jgi:hypothetical protein
MHASTMSPPASPPIWQSLTQPPTTVTAPQMEGKLIRWCKEQWDKKKNISRGIIFRKSKCFYPSHCEGNVSMTTFERMKKWFYGGFKKRLYLSKRRISSTGQKLPKDWEIKGAEIIARVGGAMMPIQRPDGSFIPGVNEDNMSNFDHSPFYIEDHSNACWGLKESTERRCILTGGKEKDRFTAQLTIFMSGRKVCV